MTSRDMVFVYDAENYRPALTRADDFAAFWLATMADMRARPLDLKMTPVAELSNAHKTVSLVSFTGLGGRRIEGWLEEPAAEGKYAANFGSRVQNYQWPKPGPNDAASNVQLVIKTYRDAIYHSGLESRETAEFREVYAEHARCVDVLATREQGGYQADRCRGGQPFGSGGPGGGGLGSSRGLGRNSRAHERGDELGDRLLWRLGRHAADAPPAGMSRKVLVEALGLLRHGQFCPGCEMPRDHRPGPSRLWPEPGPGDHCRL